jgi:hypothetical protein
MYTPKPTSLLANQRLNDSSVRWNLKLITGTIESTRTAKSNVREQCFVMVAWEFPGNVSTNEVNRRNLKAGKAVIPPSEDSGGTFSAHEAGVGVPDGRLGEGDGDRCAYSADGVTVAEGCRPCTPRNSPADGDKEVLYVHGYEWVEKPVLAPVGSPVSRQPWRVRALSGIFTTRTCTLGTAVMT